MQLENVRQHFEKEAFNYDDLITRLIPKYHEQHNVLKISDLAPAFVSAWKLISASGSQNMF
jgi:hypothetical protein